MPEYENTASYRAVNDIKAIVYKLKEDTGLTVNRIDIQWGIQMTPGAEYILSVTLQATST